MLKMVVLPAPFGPMRPLMSPSGSSNDAAFTARRPRNDFEIARTSSSAIAPPAEKLRLHQRLVDRVREPEQGSDADKLLSPDEDERPLDEADERQEDDVVPLHSRSFLAMGGQMPCGRNMTTARSTTP